VGRKGSDDSCFETYEDPSIRRRDFLFRFKCKCEIEFVRLTHCLN